MGERRFKPRWVIAPAAILAIGGAFVMLKGCSRTSTVVAVREDGRVVFPRVAGENLLREPVQFPDDLRGRPTLALVAYRQRQQVEIDTWLVHLARLEAAREGVRVIEIPTISAARWGWMAGYIDNAMRSGIPDPAARERTITLYTDVGAFNEALELPDADRIYAIVLDEDARVVLVETGPATSESVARVEAALRNLPNR